jgi:threonylcarbamoyladenosine tRNA methylthiotransferase MtaB
LPLADRPTVAIETHGCKLNQADSDALAWQFMEAGFDLVSADEAADVYVVNSCTVTHVADRKARHALRAARRRNPDATIVATGCYAQRSPEELRRLEEVDLVIGNADKVSLVRQVVDWRGEATVPCAVGDDAQAFSPRLARTRAMVKIQEGCNQVCAYCIVPRVRGRERSIPPNDVIGEINRHLSRGYKEVVLTGTQLGSYGFDLADTDLVRLLERILIETDVARLRVSSLQPQEISDVGAYRKGVGAYSCTPLPLRYAPTPLLELWSDRRLCPHFHLPLQSGSDTVLKRMRRRYTARLYAEAVELVRERIPDVAITADVIAGFPGETDEEFEETYALCQRVGFASMHVFPYSVRPGTSAAHFGDQVASEVKSRRAQALLELAETQEAQFRMRSLGQVRPVLWEEAREANGLTLWSGLTDNYIRVVGESAAPLANQITMARLTSLENGLVHACPLP